MKVVSTVNEVRLALKAEPGLTWGCVPTMGYLHEGHLSLVRRARAENDRVSVSIFVNPTQFNSAEDLTAYPRDVDRDLRLLEAEKVDLVFTPTPAEMYPPGYQTYVNVEEVAKPLEGASRPGHFRGVATVVTKLFNILQPTRAYFGQKDAQQVAVIKQMVADLNFNLEVIVCPTVREPDGLAMSSRNARLNRAERQAATVLYCALAAAEDAFESGERDADRLQSLMAATIAAEPLARLDYVSVAHPETLEELAQVKDRVLLSMAVFIGEVRLIDNLICGGD
jgi:pantoate--beta-alanine ligase